MKTTSNNDKYELLHEKCMRKIIHRIKETNFSCESKSNLRKIYTNLFFFFFFSFPESDSQSKKYL